MQTILLTGGTGLVGTSLCRHLTDKGYRVIILSRSEKKNESDPLVTYASWDVKKQVIDIAAVQSADFIVHLAGAGVMEKRWTPKYKREIIESRTLSSKLLIDTLNNFPNRVKAIISSSAIGWYGEDLEKNKAFVESDKPATDFLAETCVRWEEAISLPTKMNIRVCKLRTGIVLSNEGGAMAAFKDPMKYGVAGIPGSGKQMLSWIHIDDLSRMFIFAIQNESMHGSYNAVANLPLTNKQFLLKLAKVTKGNFIIPLHVPAFFLKMMMGERSVEVLKSTTVSNAKIKQAGFTFLYPTIDAALGQLS